MPKRAVRGKKKSRERIKKLRPEQLQQEAAIKEIEAFLSKEISVGPLRDELIGRQKKLRRLKVTTGGLSSPYVVDLKEHNKAGDNKKKSGGNASRALAAAGSRLTTFFAYKDGSNYEKLPSATAIIQPKYTKFLKRMFESWSGRAQGVLDPLAYFEPYSSNITILWLVRMTWLAIMTPLAAAGRLFVVVWRKGRGIELLARMEVAARVVVRGFWISGSVVIHAAGAAAGEIAGEVMRGAYRAGDRLIGRIRRFVDIRKYLILRVNRQKNLGAKKKKPRSTVKRVPWQALQRRLAAFAIMAAIVVVPLKLAGYFEIVGAVKGIVLGESEEAAGYIQAALADGQTLSFTDAAADFGAAAQSFASARAALDSYASAIAIASTIPLRQAQAPRAVERLLRSGEAASRAAYHLSLAIDALELIEPDGAFASSTTLAPLTERIGAFRKEAVIAHKALAEMSDEIKELDTAVVAHLPSGQAEAVAEQVARMQKQADLLESGLNEILAAADFFRKFLGDERDTRYLIVFQNNAEMRASGGFIGSFALANFRQGKLKNLEVPGGGSYDLQGGLHQRVAAPDPLHLINPLWEFQDANWWPDWPTSAKKLEWFFVNGWGSSVDGIIAVTPTLIEDILRVIGPIDMQATYGTIITADNFYTVVQGRDQLVDEDRPKMIIRDLAEKIIAELPKRLTWEKLTALAEVINFNLASKQILFSFNDESLQAFADERNWSGRLAEARGDYLMVVNTNIAGGKSDRRIKQNIEHSVEVTPDGGATVVLTITREHTARRGEPFSGVRNVNYMRVYVPLGSELLYADGFLAPDSIYFDEPAENAEPDYDLAAEKAAVIDKESGVRIYQEAGKTVFAHWNQVDSGEKIELVLKYKLPFKIQDMQNSSFDWRNFLRGQNDISAYSLIWQKQPGDTNTTYASNLRLLGPQKVVWPQPGTTEDVFIDGWRLQGDLNRDKHWGVVVEKK